jgi:DNA-binding GntR family transcriptional regulator
VTEYEDEFQSASDKAYELIRDMILTGELKPGEKLIRRKLATIIGVSTIPVLEALLRLEASGIVESVPYRGSRVIQITMAKIRDWYSVREAIECQVAREITTTLTERQLDDLEATAVILDEKEQAQDTGAEFWNLHYEFHVTMAKHTGHQSLIAALDRINLFNLLQRAQFSAAEHSSQIPRDNHARLIRALRSRDPQVAEETMREHIIHSGILDASNADMPVNAPLSFP